MTSTTSQPTTSDGTPTRKTNTLGIVALVLTIIGLLLSISLIGIFFGIPLLVIGLFLGVIAVWKKPRSTAVISIVIALIPLGILGCITYWSIEAFRQPVTNFSARVDTEAKTNTEFRLVLDQPGFNNFFRQRVKDRLLQLDLQDIIDEYKTAGLTASLQRYTELVIAEMQNEMFNAVDARIQQYGIPVSETDDVLDGREVEDVIDTAMDSAGDSLAENIEEEVIQDVEAILQSLNE